MGLVDKVKFYDTRIMKGEYESTKSQLYKIGVARTAAEHPWLKDEGN